MSLNCLEKPVWRIRDVYPGSWFYPSRISDPGSRIQKQQQKTGVKKSFLSIKPFFVATNFAKLNIILFLICWRKKFCPILQELLKFLPKKLSPCPPKNGFGIRDPGSGKNLFRIPDPDPQHCEKQYPYCNIDTCNAVFRNGKGKNMVFCRNWKVIWRNKKE